MKKKIIFFTIFVVFLLIIHEFIFNKNLIFKSLFEYLILNKNNYFLIITANFLYFLTPLPVTPIILFNGFFYGFFGRDFFNFFTWWHVNILFLLVNNNGLHYPCSDRKQHNFFKKRIKKHLNMRFLQIYSYKIAVFCAGSQQRGKANLCEI